MKCVRCTERENNNIYVPRECSSSSGTVKILRLLCTSSSSCSLNRLGQFSLVSAELPSKLHVSYYFTFFFK